VNRRGYLRRKGPATSRVIGVKYLSLIGSNPCAVFREEHDWDDIVMLRQNRILNAFPTMSAVERMVDLAVYTWGSLTRRDQHLACPTGVDVNPYGIALSEPFRYMFPRLSVVFSDVESTPGDSN